MIEEFESFHTTIESDSSQSLSPYPVFIELNHLGISLGRNPWYPATFPMYIFILKRKSRSIDLWCSGGRLNKKDGLTRYGDSHVKDKTS